MGTPREAPDPEAPSSDSWFDSFLARQYLESLQPGAGEEDLRCFGWRHLSRALNGRAVALEGLRSGALAIRFIEPGFLVTAVARDGPLIAWDAADGRAIASRSTLVFRGHGNAVTSALFLPDGRALATGSDDGTVRLWDLATGEERLALRAHRHHVNALATTPDGSILVSAGGRRSPPEAEIVFWSGESEPRHVTRGGQR
jgi:WD40 repeat protein